MINHVGKYVPLIWCYENDPSRLWSSLSKTHNPRLEEHHPTNPKWGTIYKYLSNIPSKNQAHQKQGQPEKPSECRGAYGDMVTAHGTVTETGFQSRKTASGKTKGIEWSIDVRWQQHSSAGSLGVTDTPWSYTMLTMGKLEAGSMWALCTFFATFV